MEISQCLNNSSQEGFIILQICTAKREVLHQKTPEFFIQNQTDK